MKTILDILDFSLSGGFWHFIGCYLLLSIPFKLLEKVFIKPLSEVFVNMVNDGKEKEKKEDDYLKRRIKKLTNDKGRNETNG